MPEGITKRHVLGSQPLQHRDDGVTHRRGADRQQYAVVALSGGWRQTGAGATSSRGLHIDPDTMPNLPANLLLGDEMLAITSNASRVHGTYHLPRATAR